MLICTALKESVFGVILVRILDITPNTFSFYVVSNRSACLYCDNVVGYKIEFLEEFTYRYNNWL